MGNGVESGSAGKARIGPGTVAAGIMAVVAGAGGVRLIQSGSASSLSAGFLLAIVALAAAAVAIGARPYGPETEGPLDLSARIGLGLLGGVLAGLAHGVLTWLAGATGLVGVLGVDVDVQLATGEWGMRALYGAAWGFLLGVAYPWMPGRGFASRGAAFSALPSLYVLLFVYPVIRRVGVLGWRMGALTWLVVLIGFAAAAVVAAAVIEWGRETEHAPVGRPLVE